MRTNAEFRASFSFPFDFAKLNALPRATDGEATTAGAHVVTIVSNSMSDSSREVDYIEAVGDWYP